MNVRSTPNHRIPGPIGRSLPGDLLGGALPVLGMFAQAENMESLVRYPQGEPIYLRKGYASVELCQAGVRANLLGSAALAGSGILAASGLAAAATPVLALAVGALSLSGAVNALARQQIQEGNG